MKGSGAFGQAISLAKKASLTPQRETGSSALGPKTLLHPGDLSILGVRQSRDPNPSLMRRYGWQFMPKAGHGKDGWQGVYRTRRDEVRSRFCRVSRIDHVRGKFTKDCSSGPGRVAQSRWHPPRSHPGNGSAASSRAAGREDRPELRRACECPCSSRERSGPPDRARK